MISDDQLNEYRIAGTKMRVIRDANPANDIAGIVGAWDEQQIMIRKQNRKIVKLSRGYTILEFAAERPVME